MEQYWNCLGRPERDEYEDSFDEDRILEWKNFYEKNGHVFDDWYDNNYWGRDPEFDEQNDEYDHKYERRVPEFNEDDDGYGYLENHDSKFYDHAIPTAMRQGGGYYDNFGNELIEDDWKDEIEREDDWFDDFTQEEGCPHPLLDLTEKEMIALMKRDKSFPLRKIEDTPQAADQHLPRLGQPKTRIQPKTKQVQPLMENVHPIEYKKVIQNSNEIAIRSIENVTNAIRTFKNHSLLCDDCGASDGLYSTFIKQEVKLLLHQVDQLHNLIKKS